MPCKDLKDCLDIILTSGVKMTSPAIANKIIADPIFDPFRQNKINQATSRNINPAGQIAAEIGSQFYKKAKKYNKFDRNQNSDGKWTYFLKIGQSSVSMASDILNLPKKSMFTEHDLYPLVLQWRSGKDVVSKRIDERRSSNGGAQNANKWLHPDIVSVTRNIPLDFDDDNTKELYSTMNSDAILIGSYEIKKELTLGNCRKHFFQTVANSSWANEAWLGAEIIHENAYTELQLLCDQFGVGLFEINVNDPKSTIERIPAKQSDLDWGAIARISKTNTDFNVFIGNVVNFIKTPTDQNFQQIGK